MEHNQELINLFANNPTLEKVWVNEAGEWVFVALEGFTEISREELLQAETPKETEPSTKKPSKK